MSDQQIGAAAVVRPETGRSVSGRRFRVLLCASGMCFMIMLDSNIVAVSLPSIARDLGAAFSDIERVVRACRRRCPISAPPPLSGSTLHMRAVR